jgi:hypothetical protein
MRPLVIVSCLLLLCGGVLARDARLTVGDLDVAKTARYAGDCVIGNTDFDGLQGHYDAWWWGFEDYAYLVQPAVEGCACDPGVKVMAIHFLLGLDTDTNLNVQVALHNAVDGGGGCMVPDAEYAASDVFNISGITEFAYYDVEVPIVTPCATPDEAYFLVFRFLDNGASSVAIPIDSTPTACADYNDWGSGWEDLITAGFLGDIYIWADVDCCDFPVPSEGTSWGTVKSLYR